jgi:hypothetical protein
MNNTDINITIYECRGTIKPVEYIKYDYDEIKKTILHKHLMSEIKTIIKLSL